MAHKIGRALSVANCLYSSVAGDDYYQHMYGYIIHLWE